MTDAQELSPSGPLPIWYWLFDFAGAALIVILAWRNHQDGGQQAWLLGMAALMAYLSLPGFVECVADRLKIATMPHSFLRP